MTAPFMDRIKPEVAGAVDSFIQQKLDLTVEEFLKKTGLWKQELGPYDLEPGEASVSFALTNPVRYVANVHGVWFNGTKLRPRMFTDPVSLWSTGVPSHYMPELPDTLLFNPVPATFHLDSVVVKASVYPRSADNAPSWLGERYLEEIACGTLSKIMLIPDKPYSNSTLGAYYRRKFLNALVSGKRAAQNTFQQGAASWAYPYFAGNER